MPHTNGSSILVFRRNVSHLHFCSMGYLDPRLVEGRTRWYDWILFSDKSISNCTGLMHFPRLLCSGIPVINPRFRCETSCRESNSSVNASFPWHSAWQKTERKPRHRPATPHIVVLDKALHGRDGDSAVALESMMDGVELLYTIHEQEEALHKLLGAWKVISSPKSRCNCLKCT